jgi:catechol 2,3-dioxygenase-like lactoylglutathione lyase family enzyme
MTQTSAQPAGETAEAAKLEQIFDSLVEDYLSRNSAARVLKAKLEEAGVGFRPVIDHITIRTMEIDRRAEEFLNLGYRYSETLSYADWFAKVYRIASYPALFIDQAYADARGHTSIIPGWVKQFGDQTLHHIAVRVENIELAIARLRVAGVSFVGEIVGERDGVLRQIFTAPERVDGQPFSVLELTERHRGFQGFSPPQADGLMKSTR